jgi:predicted AAA+ superfamily ATPase
MIPRRLAPLLAGSAKSILLLGPRQTGKSTLLTSLRPQLTINLAEEAVYLEFLRNPRELEERLGALPRTSEPSAVLIDEVQRLPSLLNTLQALLDREPRRWKFLLCGSSARKLRRGGANLLPGRVHTYRLGPIVSGELDYRMATREALSTGTLPGVLVDPDPAARRKTLRSYAATYLKEEVQAESLSRNLEGFARYLSVVAAWSGQFLDHAKLAAAAQVSRPSAVRWFEVLEDTLIVLRAEAFAKSLTRRLVQHPKLYFFDVGVLNGLLPNFEVSADRIGLLFEHLVFGQLVHGAAARDVDVRLSTFRTEHGAEVDFVVELERTVWAIELKASRRVDRTDLRGLRRFADYYGRRHRPVVLYLGDERRRIESVDVLPWQEGLREMGL